MVGEAGDFKCLRDPPQALCFTEAGAFLLAHTAGYILGLGSIGARRECRGHSREKSKLAHLSPRKRAA
jgi:hypothetical protein